MNEMTVDNKYKNHQIQPIESMNHIKTAKKEERREDSFSQKSRAMTAEEYSFNQAQSDQSASGTYLQSSAEESGLDLRQKYSSIFEELRGIDTGDITELFLEELEEHQKSRSKLSSLERQLENMEEENYELKALLSKKRESIAQLCLTESDHLNLIEQLEGQINSKCFSTEGHFQKKYRQLEIYMNEYIASTQEVQEQLLKNIKLAKSDNSRLTAAHHQLQELSFSQVKQIQVLTARNRRLKKMCVLTKEKESNLTLSIANLEEHCAVLKKENESLQLDQKSNMQMKTQLTQENRELSSQLNFIRQKMNENNSIRKDIFDKIEEHQENSLKMTSELQSLRLDKEELEQQCQQLQYLLKVNNSDKTKMAKEKDLLQLQCQQMTVLLETARSELTASNSACQQLRGEVDRLNNDLLGLAQELQLMQGAFQDERASKEDIKTQLLELADQVRFMEQTYKKEISQNERIKIELQKFWKQRDGPLLQVCSNKSLEHSPTFERDTDRSQKGQPISNALEKGTQ